MTDIKKGSNERSNGMKDQSNLGNRSSENLDVSKDKAGSKQQPTEKSFKNGNRQIDDV